MKQIYQDSTITAYETDTGTRVIITKDSTPKPFFKVDVKKKGCKVKTVATRCTMETAMELARSF